MKPILYPLLADYCASLPDEFHQISDERKSTLRQLGDYIKDTRRQERPVLLMVICTHNSRRSHLGQVWLQIAATYYGIGRVQTYSGGTEATAFHPNAVACLRRIGFAIRATTEGPNPVYAVTASEDLLVGQAYSKRFDDPANPSDCFGAIMVCTDADQRCPVLLGAEKRFSVPYEDPKTYDNTSEKARQYDYCCRQIAREMFYAMEHVRG